jgi:hypothetical protein
MNRIIAALLVVALGACSGNGPGPVIGGVTIDCITADRAKIDALLSEFKPLLTGGQMDWSVAYQRAKQAGTSIGGCFMAELVQYYLGGRMAPATGDGWTARQSFEQFRTDEAGGATYHTAYGDL